MGVFAPVDFSQGFQVRINAACFARHSAVQPFAISLHSISSFVKIRFFFSQNENFSPNFARILILTH